MVATQARSIIRTDNAPLRQATSYDSKMMSNIVGLRSSARAMTVALLSLAAASLVQAKEPAFDTAEWKQRSKVAMKLMVSTVTPEYPFIARAGRVEGSGLYWLRFNKSGRVNAVKIAKSTGHRVLDQAAVNAFYQWRCQPGKVDHVIIPVTFTMSYRRIGGRVY